MDSTSDSVLVLDGLTLPTKAVQLALRLENRGLKLYRQGDFLKVNDPSAEDGKPVLTTGEIDEIRKFKPFLLLLVDYCREDHKPNYI